MSHTRSMCEHRPRGVAATEMALTMPIFALLIAGLAAFGRLVYTQLAVMTAANDCASTAAQAVTSGQALAQGRLARQASLQGFHVSQQVATGGIVATQGDRHQEISAPGQFVCQVGYPLEGRSASIYFSWILPGEALGVEYLVQLPSQDFKSNWDQAR